jgi:hypothetical protein
LSAALTATVDKAYNVITPPVAGALLGLFVGITPPLRALFFGPQPALFGAGAGTATGANATTLVCNGTLYVDMQALPLNEGTLSTGGIGAALFGPTLTSAMVTFAGAVGPIVAITLGSNIVARPPKKDAAAAAAVAAVAVAAPLSPPPLLPPPPPPTDAVAASVDSPVPAGIAGEQPQPDCDSLMSGGSGSDSTAAMPCAPPPLPLEDGVRTPVLLAICAVRLVLSPLFGIALCWAGCRAGLIVPDPVLLLTLLVQSAMPSAMNLQLLTDIIAKGKGGASNSMARMLAAQYLSSVFTITLFLTLFLSLLSSGFFAPG